MVKGICNMKLKPNWDAEVVDQKLINRQGDIIELKEYLQKNALNRAIAQTNGSEITVKCDAYLAIDMQNIIDCAKTGNTVGKIHVDRFVGRSSGGVIHMVLIPMIGE